MVSSSFARSCALLFSLAASALAQTTCTLTVPANPLTAQGLSTPYQVSGCNQNDFAAQASFVEAAIFDPATNAITIYHPLVVNAGSTAGKNFIAPVPAIVPAGATVGIWFGSNAMTLVLAGAGAAQCVNGLGNSVFGQFAYCNGDVFMKTTQAAAAAGQLTIPPLGQTNNGQGACPSTRDFRVVDMDQSDNVDTTYLLINNAVLAQNTPANAKNNTKAQEITNGSDNALINNFIQPALGCKPWMVASLTAPSGMTSALALNELQAGANPAAVPALVPMNDDFAVVNNNGAITQSMQKTNLYRAGVGQPPAAAAADAAPTAYCKNYAQSGIFIANNMALFSGKTSPAPAMANNLYTFLAQRFSMSYAAAPALGCVTLFNIQNPVTLTMANCIATAATINTGVLNNIINGVTQPAAASAAAAAPASSGAAKKPATTATAAKKPMGTAPVGTAPAAKQPATTAAAGTGAKKGAANNGAATSVATTSAAATKAAATKGAAAPSGAPAAGKAAPAKANDSAQRVWKRLQTNNVINPEDVAQPYKRRFATDVKRSDDSSYALAGGFIEK